jgi:peptidoglycan hydrolase-like amidase
MAAALAATVTISVFGLLHPHELAIEAFGPSRVRVTCGPSTRVLEGRMRIPLRAGCEATGVSPQSQTDFLLSVTGPIKIRRHYRGMLRVVRNGAELTPVITMSLETAVASAVAAEAPAGSTETMLEVQAIVSRSYYLGSPAARHKNSEFCDTTHCQFIKDPPAPGDLALEAAHATEGKAIWFNDRIVQTYYAARCNDALAPLPGSKVKAGEYPYYAVRCEYCARHLDKAPLRTNARPHHHGLCQMGALDLARDGLNVIEVITHYFPGTEVRTSR